MQLGKVIRTYRKNKNMTQEEMAGRLGVTAPAVNKWENGNSLPDITLLAPIARLLDISLNTLLSFQEDLTEEEIQTVIYELDAMLKERPYDEAFWWVRRKLEEYPNCEQLIWQAALILDVQRTVKKILDAEKYDAYLLSLYTRVLESKDEFIRRHAAEALFGFYMRKEAYDKAEEYLKYLPEQDPVRKIKQAQLYQAAGRRTEAYKEYEELLFSGYQVVNGALSGIYSLTLQDRNMEKAQMLADKQTEMARCFGMGKYYEASAGLEMATMKKDAEAVLEIMREMLSGLEQFGSFSGNPLYEHMNFKEMREEFREEMKQNLLAAFRDEENFGFLKEDQRWRELVRLT